MKWFGVQNWLKRRNVLNCDAFITDYKSCKIVQIEIFLPNLSGFRKKRKKKKIAKSSKFFFHKHLLCLHRRSEIPCKIYEGVQKFMTY